MSTVGIHGGGSTGTGDGDVTIIAPLGPNPAADSVSVTIATDQDPIDVNIVDLGGGATEAKQDDIITAIGAITGSGQTDTEARAIQIASGTIDGNGQSVTLELNGATSAAVNRLGGSLSAQLRFYASYDDNNLYTEISAINTSTGSVQNRNSVSGVDINPSFPWSLVLIGGETHVRVTSVAYSSGTSTIQIVGTYAPEAKVGLAITSANGDTERPIGAMVIAGARSTGGYAISARADTGLDGALDTGLIVRNMTGMNADGSVPTGGNTIGMMIGGIDSPSANVYKRARIVDEDPVSDEFGIVTRNIPSGTQAVSGTLSITEPVTVDATDLDIRNLIFATDKVDVSGSLVSTKTALTPSSPTAVSVGVASTVILAANAARKGARIVNTSAARVSLSFGVPAVLDSGITLFPGGSFNMDEYDFNVAEIRGIASAAASNVGVQEFA